MPAFSVTSTVRQSRNGVESKISVRVDTDARRSPELLTGYVSIQRGEDSHSETLLDHTYRLVSPHFVGRLLENGRSLKGEMKRNDLVSFRAL